jgi:hypothetical protein
MRLDRCIGWLSGGCHQFGKALRTGFQRQQLNDIEVAEIKPRYRNTAKHEINGEAALAQPSRNPQRSEHVTDPEQMLHIEKGALHWAASSTPASPS